MKKDKLIIFDFDGVVVDSEPIAIQAIQESLERNGINVSLQDSFTAFVGRSFACGLANLAQHLQIDISKLPEGFEAVTKGNINVALANKLKPIRNIKTALNNITYQKCIASGSDYERLDISLKKTSTAKYFKGVFSSSSVERGKPSPDVFLYAARKMGFTLADCIIIEDSKAGIEAGLAAGIKTLLYSSSSYINFVVPNEVTVFSDMKTLPSLL